MKIIVAPDKFKGSLTANEVCEAIRRGLHQVDGTAEVILHPLADGGEGTLDILADHLPLSKIEAIVQDPLFRPVRASYLRHEEKAYIEMASASGLPLLKETERNCRLTTTYGTGQLIRNAWQRGVRQLSLFVGGSATNDLGMGMASALGYRFLNKKGQHLKPIGENLIEVDRIDASNCLVQTDLMDCTLVSDVQNPLYGEQGAAHVFAAQKGANPEDISFLDRGLRHLASVIERDLGLPVADLPGAGAAGGLGAGGVAFLGASLQSGIQTMIQSTQLEQQLSNVDLIITGEGMFDHQSLQGKVVAGVAQLAQRHKIPCMVIAGNTNLSTKAYQPLGIDKVFTVMNEEIDLRQAIAEAAVRVEDLAKNLLRSL